jgi:hypothetical protein
LCPQVPVQSSQAGDNTSSKKLSASIGANHFLKVHALKNFETTSLRSFSTSNASNYDTASMRSDISSLTDLGGPLDLTAIDEDLDKADSSSTTAQKNFLILDRLNKKQQQRREQLRLKRQQQKIDELKQKQHELEVKALQQQHQASNYLISNASLFGAGAETAELTGRLAPPASTGSLVHSSSLVQTPTSPTMSFNNSGAGFQQSGAYNNSTQAPFQLKYYYQPSQQLVQFNLNAASPRVHMIQSTANLSRAPAAVVTPVRSFYEPGGGLRPAPSVSSVRTASFVSLSTSQEVPIAPSAVTSPAPVAPSPAVVPSVNSLAKLYVSLFFNKALRPCSPKSNSVLIEVSNFGKFRNFLDRDHLVKFRSYFEAFLCNFEK